MQDDTNDEKPREPELDPESEEYDEVEEEPPADRLKRQLAAKFRDRPLMVYIVLAAGAVVLLTLLIIVWISATGDDKPERPPCYDISSNEATNAVQTGIVDNIEIFLDRKKPELGPSVIRLNLTDGTCRELPKGADNVDFAYQLIGVVEIYNRTHDEGVEISYERTDVLPEFLVTSTPLPTGTAVPTETPVPSETPRPTHTRTPTVAPSKTAPVAPASPRGTVKGVASPQAR